MDEWTSFSSSSVENAAEDGEPPSSSFFPQYPAHIRKFRFLPLQRLFLPDREYLQKQVHF